MLYDYLFDEDCPAAALAGSPDPFAVLLSTAFVHSLCKVLESNAKCEYQDLLTHQRFGVGMLGEMLAYSNSASGSHGIHNVPPLSADHIAATTQATKECIAAYPLKRLPKATDLPVLIGKCYVKSIGELSATSSAPAAYLSLHHTGIAFDLVFHAMECFALYGPKRASESEIRAAFDDHHEGDCSGRSPEKSGLQWQITDLDYGKPLR
jgi:hypothetical protein